MYEVLTFYFQRSYYKTEFATFITDDDSDMEAWVSFFILDVLESRNEYDVEVGGDSILENRNDSHADPNVVFSD